MSDRATLEAMTRALAHRGPDGEGFWLAPQSGLALGHRRLSIQDLSAAGDQPMVSACGRYTIVFNGEIYNHLELRLKLERSASALRWRGHSDTETLLACIAAWGLRDSLESLVGMFAFAVWDETAQVLSLARDRMGEKPLYYGWQGNTLLFGSELKALMAHPAFERRIDRNSLALLLRHNCIPAPYSIYQNIAKLRPGHCIQLNLTDPESAKASEPIAYWSLNQVVAAGLAQPFDGNDTQAIAAMHEQLAHSVQAQLISDVPVGAFLSGGVDSSAIVALMQAHSNSSVKTFTIGYNEGSHNEAEYAKKVAQHLGTEHTELYVDPSAALDIIPRLPEIFCEPFSNSSQLPTLLICQLTSQHVRVALDGDGGDELFGGYNRYLGGCDVWERLQSLPRPLRFSLASMLQSISTRSWDRLYGLVKPLQSKQQQLAWPGDKLHKIADVMRISEGHHYYQHLLSHWEQPSAVVLGANEPATLITDQSSWPNSDDLKHWMMAMDAKHYIPEDNLVRLDRAAMSCGLETRAPLLDHRVVELAWRMPLSLKIRNGQGKWLLRQLLYQHVPKELIERPKMGFAVPIADWLRGTLRDWAEELLDENALRQEGYFDPQAIRDLWKSHLIGSGNFQGHLWDVLMFQAWLRAENAQ